MPFENQNSTIRTKNYRQIILMAIWLIKRDEKEPKKLASKVTYES